MDGKAEIKEEHIRWNERFKKLGLYEDKCDDISDIGNKRIKKWIKKKF